MDEPHSVRKMMMNIAFAGAAAVLVTAAGATGWLRHRLDEYGEWFVRNGNLLEGLARTLCLTAALILGGVIFSRLRQRLGEEKTVAQRPGQPDVPWLQRLQASAAERLSEQDRKAITMFVELIVDPARSRSRLAETVDLDERAVRQQVSISFALPDAEDGGRALYIPILQPIKGELVDNFQLQSAGGSALPTLSYEETTKLAAAGLRLILMEIFAAKDAPSLRRPWTTPCARPSWPCFRSWRPVGRCIPGRCMDGWTSFLRRSNFPTTTAENASASTSRPSAGRTRSSRLSPRMMHPAGDS